MWEGCVVVPIVRIERGKREGWAVVRLRRGEGA